MSDISREGLDEWIATLMECKPITEAQVKQLCDKVAALFSIACSVLASPAWSRPGAAPDSDLSAVSLLTVSIMGPPYFQ